MLAAPTINSLISILTSTKIIKVLLKLVQLSVYLGLLERYLRLRHYPSLRKSLDVCPSALDICRKGSSIVRAPLHGMRI